MLQLVAEIIHFNNVNWLQTVTSGRRLAPKRDRKWRTCSVTHFPNWYYISLGKSLRMVTKTVMHYAVQSRGHLGHLSRVIIIWHLSDFRESTIIFQLSHTLLAQKKQSNYKETSCWCVIECANQLSIPAKYFEDDEYNLVIPIFNIINYTIFNCLPRNICDTIVFNYLI